MIENWNEFFNCVSKMREYQNNYFKTRDPLMLGEARVYEKIIDECIALRMARQMPGLFEGKQN